MPTAVALVTPVDRAAGLALHVDTIERHGRDLGIVQETIYNDHDEPGTVVIIFTIVSVSQMEAFLATPTFQDIIARAPIDDQPTF